MELHGVTGVYIEDITRWRGVRSFVKYCFATRK